MNNLTYSNASSFFIINELSLFRMNELALLKRLFFLLVNIQENMEDDLVKQALLKVRRAQRQSSFLDDFAVIYFKKTQHLTRSFFLLISSCSVGNFVSSHSIRPFESLALLPIYSFR